MPPGTDQLKTPEASFLKGFSRLREKLAPTLNFEPTPFLSAYAFRIRAYAKVCAYAFRVRAYGSFKKTALGSVVA
jgi:hypothetical protein